MDYTKKLLEEVGINPERLEMFNMSAAMGPDFARTVDEFTDKIKALGPSELKTQAAGVKAPLQ